MEPSENDVLQCGKCKLIFTSVDLFVSHKTATNCVNESRADYEELSESDEKEIRKCLEDIIVELEHQSADSASNKSSSSTSQTSLGKRYIYKCKYCTYTTKFKLHIVEHMLQEHQIYLMECPESKCRKQFKDEWKLKRHLESNRDHSPLTHFKDFNEVMQQHVEINAYKPDFKCPSCENSFATHSEWLQHVTLTHPDFNASNHHICPQCAQTFRSNYKLKCHTFNVHKRQTLSSTPTKSQTQSPPTSTTRNENEERMCQVCAKLFKGYKTFQRHIQCQHGINEFGEPLVECPVCERAFFNRKQIERHMHTHETWVSSTSSPTPSPSSPTPKIDRKTPIPEYRTTQSVLYSHECAECKTYYKSTKTLAKHKQSAHNLKPVFQCLDPTCHQQFDSMHTYIDHSKIHSQRNIECAKCHQKFASKSLLRQHVKSTHYKAPSSQKVAKNSIEPTTTAVASPPAPVQPQKFICYTCYKEFETSNSLHNHLATHSDMRLFVCGVCEHAFNTRKELSRHAASHHDLTRPAKICKICCMTFKTSFHLKRHELTRHTNIRPHKCPKCDMTFARKDKLKQHQAKHNEHPLFQCSLCSKGFYRKEHLKDHEIAKHSKQYPFKCESCNKGFVHFKDLHRHIRVRHLGFSVASASNAAGVPKIDENKLSENLNSENNNCINSEIVEKESEKAMDVEGEGEGEVVKSEVKGGKRFLKSFKCDQCEKGFFYENHLKKHVISKHSNTPLYRCSHCKLGFSTRATAKSHVANKHIEFGCAICTKKFRTRSHAQRHIHAVHGQDMRPTRIQLVHAEVVDLSETKNENNNNNSNNNDNNLYDASEQVVSNVDIDSQRVVVVESSFASQAANLIAASQLDHQQIQQQQQHIQHLQADSNILSLSTMQKVDLNANYLDASAANGAVASWHGYEYLFNHHHHHHNQHYLSQLNSKHLIGYQHPQPHQHQQQQQQQVAVASAAVPPAYNSFFDMNMNIESLNMVQMVHHHHHHHHHMSSHHHHHHAGLSHIGGQIGSGAASCFHPYQSVQQAAAVSAAVTGDVQLHHTAPP